MRLVAVATLVILGLAGTACGGSGNARNVSRRAAPTTSTTDVNTKILADFAAYNDTYSRLIAAPNPNDPALAEHTTGVELQQVRSFLLGLQATGRVLKGTRDDHPRVASLQGTTAIVDNCVTNGNVHYYDVKTGQVTGALPPTAGFELTLQLDAGTWKVGSAIDKSSACP